MKCLLFRESNRTELLATLTLNWQLLFLKYRSIAAAQKESWASGNNLVTTMTRVFARHADSRLHLCFTPARKTRDTYEAVLRMCFSFHRLWRTCHMRFVERLRSMEIVLIIDCCTNGAQIVKHQTQFCCHGSIEVLFKGAAFFQIIFYHCSDAHNNQIHT